MSSTSACLELKLKIKLKLKLKLKLLYKRCIDLGDVFRASASCWMNLILGPTLLLYARADGHGVLVVVAVFYSQGSSTQKAVLIHSAARAVLFVCLPVGGCLHSCWLVRTSKVKRRQDMEMRSGTGGEKLGSSLQQSNMSSQLARACMSLRVSYCTGNKAYASM